MAKQVTTYVISGRVFDRNSGKPVSGAKVEAWDKDLICDDLLGNVTTTANGEFTLEFTDIHFRELFLDRRPEIFFKIFVGGKLVKNTRHAVHWNVDVDRQSFDLDIDMERGESTDQAQPPPRPEWSPSNSFLLGTRGVRAVVTSDKPNIDGFLKAAGLYSDENRARIEQGMQQVKLWLDKDPGRKNQFEASPLATLSEIDPKLRDNLPEFIPSAARGACATLQSGAYNPCALELLQRVAVWLGASSANRELYASDPTIAVDAVAGATPTEAVAIAKIALQYARNVH